MLRVLTCRAMMLAGLLAPTLSRLASAQAGTSGLQMMHRDTITSGLPGSTVTTVFHLKNTLRDTLVVTPRIALPEGWIMLIGTATLTLAPGESDSWLTSVRIPSRAEAGRSTLHLALIDTRGTALATDSSMVQVLVKRGLDLALVERPTFAVTRTAYQSTFVLHNRGNVTAHLAVRATSSLGAPVRVSASSVTLRADESRNVTTTVASPLPGYQAVDDVVELIVADQESDSAITVVASSRVTIVQRANVTEPLHRVASTLRMRAADATTGVSRFELSGVGRARDDGSETVDYLLRGPTASNSSFGEREEYRVALHGSNYVARAGDGFYSFSPLTSGGQRGFGGGLEVGSGALVGGGYVERARFQINAPTERAAYLRASDERRAGAPGLMIGALDRSGGVLAGRVLSTALGVTPVPGARLDMEYALSDGKSGRGSARTVHLTGGSGVHYDLGHTRGSDDFAGAVRASEHDYATVAAMLTPGLQLMASTGMNRAGSRVVGEQQLQLPERYHSSYLELGYLTRFALRYSALDRSTTFLANQHDEWQRGVAVNADQTFGVVQLRAAADRGMARSAFDAGSHAYTELSAGITTTIGANALTLYGESSDGAVVTRGNQHVVTVGGDVRLQPHEGTLVSAGVSQQRLLSTGDRFAQLDARASQLLSTGGTLTARVRLAGYGAVQLSDHPLAYLEYSLPLGVPLGRSHAAGRVHGRIVNRETGRGVAGALVRLGPQTAITDDEGRIAFAGLPAGEYRVAVAQQSALAQSVFAGDPRVTVDSGRRAPTTFDLAIERGGTVDGLALRTVVVRTGLDGAPDSLANAGPAEGITVALVSGRDTLYRLSGADGAFRFADVPSGEWMVRPLDAAPEGLRWEPATQTIVVRTGERLVVVLRLVPRRREIRPIDGAPPLELKEDAPAPPRERPRGASSHGARAGASPQS